MINNDKNDNYINITFREYFYKKYIDRTISEGIYSVLYANTNVSEQQETQNSISKRDKFIYSLSFKDWFDLYGIYTFRKIKNRIFKYIFVFVLINILLLLSTSIYGLLQKEYRVQQALLRPADFITKFYIIPISKIWGYKNILTYPFYIVRDSLYNKGNSMLRENSAAQIIWWYDIRFVEFAALVKPYAYKLYNNDNKPISDEQKDIFKNWQNEVYNKILIFPNVNLTNTKYSSANLLIFRDIIEYYSKTMAIFSIADQISGKNYTERGIEFPGPEYYAVKDNINMLNEFDKLKSHLEKQNSIAYKTYQQKPIIDEYEFKKDIAQYLLWYEQTFETIDCDSYELQLFLNMKINMINYLTDNYKKISGRKRLNYSFSFLSPLKIEMYCPNSYEEYTKKYHEYGKFLRSKDPKNKYYSGNK